MDEKNHYKDLIKCLVLLSIIVLFLSGCSYVKPWEKKNLAEPVMKSRVESENSKFLEHTVSTIEQSEGGYIGNSVGCGCR